MGSSAIDPNWAENREKSWGKLRLSVMDWEGLITIGEDTVVTPLFCFS
jgi:hypothetical protein